MCRPDCHRAAEREIVAALVKVGVLCGETDAIIRAGVGALFFPHGLGHLIGCDTHDVCVYFTSLGLLYFTLLTSLYLLHFTGLLPSFHFAYYFTLLELLHFTVLTLLDFT